MGPVRAEGRRVGPVSARAAGRADRRRRWRGADAAAATPDSRQRASPEPSVPRTAAAGCARSQWQQHREAQTRRMAGERRAEGCPTGRGATQARAAAATAADRRVMRARAPLICQSRPCAERRSTRSRSQRESTARDRRAQRWAESPAPVRAAACRPRPPRRRTRCASPPVSMAPCRVREPRGVIERRASSASPSSPRTAQRLCDTSHTGRDDYIARWVVICAAVVMHSPRTVLLTHLVSSHRCHRMPPGCVLQVQGRTGLRRARRGRDRRRQRRTSQRSTRPALRAPDTPASPRTGQAAKRDERARQAQTQRRARKKTWERRG